MELEFISAAANTVSGTGCIKWLDSEKTVAFPVSNLIAIVELRDGKGSAVLPVITHTLRGHTGRVNALAHCSITRDLYSCSEDSTVRIWSLPRRHGLWTCQGKLEGLKASAISITCTAFCSFNIIAASDSKGNVCIWCRPIQPSGRNSTNPSIEDAPSCAYFLLQTITLPPATTPHALHFVSLPQAANYTGPRENSSGDLALMMGCVDSRIHLYVLRGDLAAASTSDTARPRAGTAAFSSVGSLQGHEEWVTCLASMSVPGSTLVASGSKDCKIRVWRVVASLAPSSTTASDTINPTADPLHTLPVPVAADLIDPDDEDELLDAPEGAVTIAPDTEVLSEARLVFHGAASGDENTCTVYSVYLETLLIGHEDWVSSVEWAPLDADVDDSGIESAAGGLVLMSTSMDRNMLLWSPESQKGRHGAMFHDRSDGETSNAGLWSPHTRLGDIGGQLGGSVGANLLGFVGGCLSPTGDSILGVGFGGSLHLWSRTNAGTESDQARAERWEGQPFCTGHFGAVSDLAWAGDDGSTYLTTVSADQTSRIFAPVSIASNVQSGKGIDEGWGWRELSRPQIHGYTLNACVPFHGKCVLTAGEEKLLRIFAMPNGVARGLRRLCGGRAADEGTGTAEGVERGYIPELGLSNRAYCRETLTASEAADLAAREALSGEGGPLAYRADSDAMTTGLKGARGGAALIPLEGQLADYTVWPEVCKLFGHQNDVMAVALSPSVAGNASRFLASVSKARSVAAAAIFLWRVEVDPVATSSPRVSLLGQIQAHDSTIVALQFSPCGRYLASSGKDRALCICRRDSQSASGLPYSLYAEKKSAHKRIVWDLAWVPLSANREQSSISDGLEQSDDVMLVTASRDGSCKVWLVQSGPSTLGAVIDGGGIESKLQLLHSFDPFSSAAITAIDIRVASGTTRHDASNCDERYVMALGAESGDVEVWALTIAPATSGESSLQPQVESKRLSRAADSLAHGSTVRRLRWRPDGEQRSNKMLLASGGDDCTVRVFSVSEHIE